MNLTDYQRQQLEHKFHLVEEAIKTHKTKIAAAKALGVDRKTLYNIIARYKLVKRVE